MLPIETACELLPSGPHHTARIVVKALAPWLVGLVPVGIVVGLVVGPSRRVCSWGETKVDVAMLTVTRYANEAFPRWAAAHPERACPVSPHDLDPYMDHASHRDPWGHDYVFTCGDHTLYVMSLGEDGRSNTADDIWSHDVGRR